MGGSAPVLTGTNSILAMAAGIIAVVGVSAFHKRRLQRDRVGQESITMKSPAIKNASPSSQVFVGLLCVHVPKNWRDLVKIDICLEKAVSQVSRTLIIYVSGHDKHEIVNYTSELYNLVWDVVCIHNKPHLDIRIIGDLDDSSMPSWDDLLLLPELNAVFGEETLIDVQRMNAKRFEQDGLFAVTYHPLAMHTTKYLRDEYHYFEDEHTRLTPLFDSVLLGGTFDHLHNGHKKLLSLAVSICSTRLIIGITSEVMLQQKQYAEWIESIEVRTRHVREFVSFLKPTLQVECSILTDAFGPSITFPGPAAIVMSTETLLAAEKINQIRMDRGLSSLSVYVCRRTDGSTLSSTFIRERLARSGAIPR